MNETRTNYAAVAVAAVLYWVMGAMWFSLLAEPWLAGIEKTAEQIKQQVGDSPHPYIVALLCNLTIAYFLAWLVPGTGEQTAGRGAKLGALLWLGFVATTMATNYVFEARSLQIFAINAGYPLVGMVVMGAIVGGWKKKAKAQSAVPASA